MSKRPDNSHNWQKLTGSNEAGAFNREELDDILFQHTDHSKDVDSRIDLGNTNDPLFVKLESFFDFSFSLSEELEDLVEEQREFSRTLEWNEWDFEYQLRKENGSLSEESNFKAPK